MAKLLSVGIDVGTTTTQLIVSELTVQNRGGAFSVPDMVIGERRLLYESPVHFTPLLNEKRIDGPALGKLIEEEYRAAGITPAQVDTGAIIITGETSRKENAAAALEALERFAGEFVVATAGPDLESALAAKGAGAVDYSRDSGKTVLHIDIGGGTSNFALIREGTIVKTGCLNVGGRLVKIGPAGEYLEVSPAIKGIFPGKPGEKADMQDLEALADSLTQALEMAAGLRPPTGLLRQLTTAESSAAGLEGAQIISFSGGVADCIDRRQPPLVFGDMGPILGRAIRQSRLCAGEYRLGSHTIRATVLGAGCHATQLSGSTVFYRDVALPLKNLPVLALPGLAGPDFTGHLRRALARYDSPPVLALPGFSSPHYGQITALAQAIVAAVPQGPIYVALEADMAKALGHALALLTRQPILCVDRLRLADGSFLDVGQPVGDALPVVIKTLILKENV